MFRPDVRPLSTPRLAALAVTMLAAPAAHAPAVAEQSSLPTLRVVPEQQGCTGVAAEEILVCGERDTRFRLPLPEGFDPNGEVESVSRERHRLMEGGESGIHSCSNVGMSGRSGCELRGIRRNEQQGRQISVFGDIELNRRDSPRRRGW